MSEANTNDTTINKIYNLYLPLGENRDNEEMSLLTAAMRLLRCHRRKKICLKKIKKRTTVSCEIFRVFVNKTKNYISN